VTVTGPFPTLDVVDLGRMAYGQAYEEQVRRVEAVRQARDAGAPVAGTILLVEHDPVITVSRRAGARDHLVATPELLARNGVAVEETDRGGDITYHGPGQLVAYPILDLNLLNLGIHEYMRMLEGAVIQACAEFGIVGNRDPGCTGVWVARPAGPSAKICAMGVRVRRWVSMHGLALNVTTNLDHFALIVPCGLAGRPVTTLAGELGARCPPMERVKGALAAALRSSVEVAWRTAVAKRRAAAGDGSIISG